MMVGERREVPDLRKVLEKDVQQRGRWKPPLWRKQETGSVSFSELDLNCVGPEGNPLPGVPEKSLAGFSIELENKNKNASSSGKGA